MINKLKTSRRRDKASKNEAINNPLPRLAYTMREAAEILGISYITVHRLLKRGHLRSSGAIRNKVIPRAEIERFLRDSLTQAKP